MRIQNSERTALTLLLPLARQIIPKGESDFCKQGILDSGDRKDLVPAFLLLFRDSEGGRGRLEYLPAKLIKLSPALILMAANSILDELVHSQGIT